MVCAGPGVTCTVTFTPKGAPIVLARKGSTGAPAWEVAGQPGSDTRTYRLSPTVTGSRLNCSQGTATSKVTPVSVAESKVIPAEGGVSAIAPGKKTLNNSRASRINRKVENNLLYCII